jgi:hypothetical protein
VLKHKEAMTAALCVCVIAFSHTHVFGQLAQTPNEAELLAAIKIATNPTLKLTAAEDFVARFPNSDARLIIAEMIAADIRKIKNGGVAVALLERALAILTSEQEREILKPVALQVYVIGDRPDEAFALAGEMLARDPDNLQVLVRMAQAGVEQARRRNRKYAEQSLQYGLKAIALIEADKKPADVDEETWAGNKANIGYLYQYTGILYLAVQNTSEAKIRFTRSSMMLPREPSNFAFLGRVTNVEYLAGLQAYEAMPEGKGKQEAKKKLDVLLDSMIDLFARAVGLATGRPEYQTLLQQVIPDLTTYYKHRHNQSTKGLKELIDRYRR